MNLLILNSGSSTLKYQIIEMPKEMVVSRGIVDGIGQERSTLTIDGKTQRKTIKTHHDALASVLREVKGYEIECVGYRVVHGGEYFKKAIKINEEVISKIDQLKSLAPLHNPRDLSVISAAKKLLPKIPHIAVFDTAFHETMPQKAFRYAVSEELYEKEGIRKYGFHGTSHKYIMQEVCKLLKKKKVNIISCHLGNGASICAIKDNKSIETTMGFTPLEGLVMGTRTGDIDPAVVEYITQREKKSVSEVLSMFNHESGLKGICGYSDMRIIHQRAEKGDKKCKLAIDIFNERLLIYIGAYIAILEQKVDALVFSAGIGEGAYYIREAICKSLGLKIDTKKNRLYRDGKKGNMLLSLPGSRIQVFVVPTNEELEIARESYDLVRK